MTVPKPYIGEVDGKLWYYIFTNSTDAQEFAVKNEQTSENGYTLIMSYTPLDFQRLLLNSKSKGVVGVIFNAGSEGWSSTTNDFMTTTRGLKRRGKIK
jgi:hypothetical protein